jgi:adenylate kinase family enzyme
MSNRSLSLHDFKKWLSTQKDLSEFFNIGREQEDPNERFVGKKARPKVCEETVLKRIETEEDTEALVKEFFKKGGTILGINGKKVQIETESGTFTLPRFCIKIRKDQ